ncbi:DnaJ subfamily C member 14 [Merluccius polli]|uniref:DnaJ subfamily C member 14 n=1 Tax=Merluccius polli TaxID=89951 RepID=A0AA47P093_MERPO|nr:DnaJ subfamily C member 14 [Merluccius polli]
MASSEREMDDVTETEEESPAGRPLSGGPPLVTRTNHWESRGREEDHHGPPVVEDITSVLECNNPQDTSNLAMPQDSGTAEVENGGQTELHRDTVDPVFNMLGQQTGVDYAATPCVDEEDEDDDEEEEEEEEDSQGGSQTESVKSQHMNGESSWRSSQGVGKRCRSRNSGGGGSVSEPSSHGSSGALFFSSIQKGSVMSGGSRHKQNRRRNHQHQQGRGRRHRGQELVLAFKELLSESLGTWCLSCIHMVIELIVALTHRCGVGVETGGMTLYNVGLQLLAKVTDVPGMKADALRVLQGARGKATEFVDKTIRSARWLKQVATTSFALVCAIVLLASQWGKSLLTRLGGERANRCWAACQDSRLWKRVSTLMESVRSWFRRKGRVPVSFPDSPGRLGKTQPGQELERLLALAQVPEEELDPFTVLGVEVHASAAELKKAYRQLAVQVHPDKNKHPRAGEAFKVLRAAWDIVSNLETRREYEIKRMAATELSKSMNEFLTKLQDDLKEAMNTMMCTKCEGKHKRFEMDREPSEARFCAECNRFHSAEEGDLWAESSMLGLRITYFAFMDGKVYDITEWAGCQRIGISPDTHRVPYHISFGSKNNGSSSRQRTPSEPAPGPSNPADLQDLFNRIFQGGPTSDMAANGGFFPPGAPHHPPGAGAPPFPPSFSPPPAHGGFFMPGAQRPETSETCAESGKPPRRRKKVRKPFQR